jgi:Zn-dependent M28 family amino/carboxypeptidase
MVLLVIRVYKVLNFSHSKLSDSQKTLLGMDFISKSKTDLSSCEWHAPIVIVEKTSEVDKDTLGSLRSEETSLSTSRSNLSLEHQVEWKSL